MAGEWIKMRTDLRSSMELWSIINDLSISEVEAMGLLCICASWFVTHGKHGRVRCEPHIVDSLLNKPGFSAALMKAGWMRYEHGSLMIRHFSNVSSVRKSLGSKIRRDVLSGATCAACGSPDKLVIDHVIPVSRGGLDVRENLQALCLQCNVEKGTKTMEEFRRDR